MNTLTKIKQNIIIEGKNNGLLANNLLAIAIFPLLIVFIYSALLTIPLTRNAALWTLEENRPIELLTFFFAIAGGIIGLFFAWQIKQHREGKIALGFYFVFAIGLLLLGAEEVAWGQWFLGFETPSAIKDINTQSELTFHNLKVWNDHLEIFPFVFGLAGLIGIGIQNIRSFRKISAPYVLLPWFVIIFLISAIDLFQDFVVIQEQFDYLINYLDEVIEMLVAISAFLYIWLNQKKFTWQWKNKQYQ
jgi:hypothetical protein